MRVRVLPGSPIFFENNQKDFIMVTDEEIASTLEQNFEDWWESKVKKYRTTSLPLSEEICKTIAEAAYYRGISDCSKSTVVMLKKI